MGLDVGQLLTSVPPVNTREVSTIIMTTLSSIQGAGSLPFYLISFSFSTYVQSIKPWPKAIFETVLKLLNLSASHNLPGCLYHNSVKTSLIQNYQTVISSISLYIKLKLCSLIESYVRFILLSYHTI